jgi:hypothetical protein
MSERTSLDVLLERVAVLTKMLDEHRVEDRDHFAEIDSKLINLVRLTDRLSGGWSVFVIACVSLSAIGGLALQLVSVLRSR